jgi:hypothetical protein
VTRPFVAFLLAAAVASGCDGSKKKTASDPPAAATVSSARPPSTLADETVLDMAQAFDACTTGHRGTLVDLGSDAGAWRYGRLRKPDVEPVEHEGATWARVRVKSVTLDVVLAEVDPEPSTVVAARVRGGAARSMSISVNGKSVGTWPLPRGETKVLVAKQPVAGLVTGANEVQLRFVTPAHAVATEAVADVDWVHVGTSDVDASLAAPTHADAVASGVVGGVTRRSISLRGPGFARCSGVFPAAARFEGALGLAGAGEADVEVRLRRDRKAPVVLAAAHLGGAAAWKPVTAPLPEAGHGTVELSVTRATNGVRALFGDARVVAPPAASGEPARPARSAVVVVLGSIASRAIAPYGGRHAMPELGTLASKGIVFEQHRASSSYAAASVASLLTGLEPRAHGLADRDAKLPPGVTTLAEAARQAGVVAAFFTANPTTTGAFGFDRPWETFDAASTDAPAIEPFDAAARWLDAKKGERFLLIVHARGGHPPWDASADEMKTLDPQGYTGPLDPRHAAELLARARKPGSGLRLGDADRARAWALYAAALERHDAALGRLLAAVRAAGRADDTAIFVTSDAAPDESSHFPFGESESLDELALSIPLVAHVPGRVGGRRVGRATASVDVAPTVLGALGLAPPSALDGVDLFAVEREGSARARVASLSDRFSVEWGGLVLLGAGERAGKICDLSLEPACVSDVRPSYPLAAEELERTAYRRLVARDVKVARVPASIDAAAAAQLKAWGR